MKPSSTSPTKKTKALAPVNGHNSSSSSSIRTNGIGMKRSASNGIEKKKKVRHATHTNTNTNTAAVSTASASTPVTDMTGLTAKEKLESLKDLLECRALSAYIIPTDDPHLCEMPPDAFRRRDYISGFTGSAGTAVVTTLTSLKEGAGTTKEDKDGAGEKDGEAKVEVKEKEEQETMDGLALLWTDGRYFLQADSELEGTPWQLMKAGMPDVPEPIKWLSQNLKPGSRVGIDPMVFTVSTARQFSETLSSVQCSLIPVEENLVDQVWESDGRPSYPKGKVRIHPLEYAGDDVQTKLSNVREEMEKESADAVIVSTLDEVAWLLNIRGADIENSPVVVAYVVVTKDKATLYVDETKISSDVRGHLQDAGVGVSDYFDIKGDLESLCYEGKAIWIDPAQCTSGLYDLMCKAIKKNAEEGFSNGKEGVQVLRAASGQEYLFDPETKKLVMKGDDGLGDSIALKDDSGTLIEKKSPLSMAKATKNEEEISGMVEAHVRDGVALVQFLEWLEITVLREGQTPSEYEISEKLCEFRAQQKGFSEPSFPTIAGEGGNGAIIHYKPEMEGCNRLSPDSMLLLDSGGQYDCGTTDVTRTVHFGEPTDHQKECYTRVLKGHIALATLVFPEGIPGFMIDSFARSSLWKGGLDYRHGTGHGVGAGLNVHEGPCGISSRYSNTTGLQSGMVLSNEPGYYEEGEFGIRIENLVYTSEASNVNDVSYLKFTDLTMVPIQKKLIQPSLLSSDEIEWLNEYHVKVFATLSPLVTGSTLEWLENQCKPL